MKFAFMRKSFWPKVVISGGVFEYLKNVKLVKPFCLISRTATDKFKDKIASSPFAEGLVLETNGEPTKKIFEDFLKKLKLKKYDAVIAVGGGSVLDLAKVLKKEIGLPLIVSPTTPSSGSEVTPYALFVDEFSKTKTLNRSFKLIPDVVVLDPVFLETIPQKQMGYFLFDVLGHCVEGLVSKMSTNFSDSFSKQGIEIINEIYKRLTPPYPKEILEKLQIAGFLGGISQGMASVGAAHSLAHYFGPKYNIPHAKAVSIFLPEVVRANAARGNFYEKLEFSGGKNAEAVLKLFEGIRVFFDLPIETIKVDNSFNQAGGIAAMRKDFCLPTNPIRFEDKDFEKIFGKCLN